MNHQGGRMGQFNQNASMQNEVNPRESNRALRSLSSTNSRTGSDQRLPDRFSRQNLCAYREGTNIIPTNDHNVGVTLLGTNISSSSSLPGCVPRFPGHAGNNRYNNQNLSLGLSLHSYGQQDQSGNSSSALNAINRTGVAGYVVEEQGGDVSSVNNTRPLPFKRRSPDSAFREFAIGESSSTGAQAGISKRRATTFQVNANDNVHISNACNCPANGHSGHFEAGIGHGSTWSNISNMQHLSEAGQTESFQSNVNLQAAANSLAFVPLDMLSSTRYIRSDSHVPLPIQPASFCQYNQHNFFSPVETPVGPICSVHPFEHVPHFCEAQQAPPWTNILRPRNSPAASWPIYSVMGGSQAMAYYQSPRNIPPNFMLGLQLGRGNLAQNPTNLSFSNANANIFGNFPYPSNQSASVPGIQLSNAREWVRRLNNIHQQYMQTSSGTATHSMVPSTAFPRQISRNPSNSNPSENSQQNFSTGLVNSILENQRRSVARPENQAGANSVRFFTSSSPDEMRIRLRDEVRSALQHLRNGGSLRLEDLMILDYSIVLNLLEAQREIDEENNSESLPYEQLIGLEDQVALTEEEILSNIGHEIFQSTTEGTPEIETCCVCQEEYVDREELGKLDCGHRFHLACIKQWLVLKNTCPICKKMALAIADLEEEDDDDE